MQDHRKLKAFELADNFALAVYRETRTFPKEEIYGLTSQLRRAAVSVPGNIVEGCGRNSTKEYLHFLNIAFGSLREAGYYVHLAHRLQYLADDESDSLQRQYDECAKVLSGLIAGLQRKAVQPPSQG